MIDMTKQYTYKNGAAARILCTDRPFTGNLVVLSMRPNGAIIQNTIDGKSQCYNGEYDLVEVWEPRKGELCFFWTESTRLIVARFEMKKIIAHDSKYQIDDGGWFKYCAPFTGTLPEAFKGVSDD